MPKICSSSFLLKKKGLSFFLLFFRLSNSAAGSVDFSSLVRSPEKITSKSFFFQAAGSDLYLLFTSAAGSDFFPDFVKFSNH